MHVLPIGDIYRIWPQVLIQNPAGKIRKCRGEFLTISAVVAERALVDLAIANELCRIENRGVRWLRRSGRAGSLLCEMICARAMTTLAGDAGDEAVLLEDVGLRVGGERPDISGVTFNAARIDMAVKVGSAVFVAWTVDPLMAVRPITQRADCRTNRDRSVRALLSRRPDRCVHCG